MLLLLLFVLAELLYLGEKSTDLNILAMSSGKICIVIYAGINFFMYIGVIQVVFDLVLFPSCQ